MKTNSNPKNRSTIKSKSVVALHYVKNTDHKRLVDGFLSMKDNADVPIAWLEKKNVIESNIHHQIINYYNRNKDLPNGYILFNNIYIEAKRLLSATELINELDQKGRRVLSVREVALLCIIKKQEVTKFNKQSIAIEYGYKNGKGVYDHYVKWNIELDRAILKLTHKECFGIVKSIKKILLVYPDIRITTGYQKLHKKLERYL